MHLVQEKVNVNAKLKFGIKQSKIAWKIAQQ